MNMSDSVVVCGSHAVFLNMSFEKLAEVTQGQTVNRYCMPNDHRRREKVQVHNKKAA